MCESHAFDDIVRNVRFSVHAFTDQSAMVLVSQLVGTSEKQHSFIVALRWQIEGFLKLSHVWLKASHLPTGRYSSLETNENL